MIESISLGEASKQLGVSVDTLRRWDRAGTLKTFRDAQNRRRVPLSEVKRLRKAPTRHRTGDSFSARNRFKGTITSVQADGVMALVELELDGGQMATAAITADSVEELGLTAGMRAVAAVKATSVMVIRED